MALLFIKGCLNGSDTESKNTNNIPGISVQGSLYPNDTTGQMEFDASLEDYENRMEAESLSKIDTSPDYYEEDSKLEDNVDTYFEEIRDESDAKAEAANREQEEWKKIIRNGS